MSKSCPECDIPPDGYPILINKGTHYWCYRCEKSYDKETLKELKSFGIPYSQVLENIRKYGKASPSEEDTETKKDSEVKNPHHQVFKNLKKFGKPFPPEEKEAGTSMRGRYICGICQDTGYDNRRKMDNRTMVRCPRDCRIKT